MRNAVGTGALVLVWVLGCALARDARAQDAPTFTESFYLMPTLDEDPFVDAIDVCGSAFGRPLTNSGSYVERNSPEVAEAVTDCLEEATSPTFARECQLAISTTEVDYIILAEVRAVTDTTWMFEASVRSPALNAGVWSGDEVIDGQHAVLVARDACTTLGERFLEARQPEVEAEPETEPVDEPDEVATVEPEPAPTPVLNQPVYISLSGGSHRFDAQLFSSAGRVFDCGDRLTTSNPCSLGSVEVGPAQLSLDGRGGFLFGSPDVSEVTEVLEEPTHMTVINDGRARRWQRIVGPILMVAGITTTTVIFANDSNGNNIGAGLAAFFVLQGGGAGLFVHGLFGPWQYRVESAPMASAP